MRLDDLVIPDAIILPNLGSYINAFKPDEQRVIARIPTSITKPGGGLDLDYTALLVVERLLVDSEIYSHIQYSDFACHKPLFETLHILRAEGYVKLCDFSKKLSGNASYIQSRINAVALQDPAGFRPILQETIRRWRGAQPALKSALGREYTAHVSVPIGIAHYLAQEGRPITAQESEKVEKLISGKRQRFSHDELDILRSVITPYVSYVYENIALRDEIGVPFIDWPDLEPFYNKAIAMPPPEGRALAERAIQNAQLLYDQVDIDLVRPTSVYALLDQLKMSGIDKLRKRFLLSALNNEITDRRWYEQQKSNLINAYKKAGKRRLSVLVSKLASQALPIHHVPILGAAVEAAANMYEEAPAKQYEWLYVIMKDGDQACSTESLLGLKDRR